MKTLEQLAREAAPITMRYLATLPGAVDLQMVEFDAAGLARFRAACRAEALEEAAIVAERLGDACAASHKYGLRDDEGELAYECAAAIREMK